MRATVVARLAGLLSTLALGCATAPNVKTERGPEGVYHLTCRTTLQVCLNQAESLCRLERYVVLRATDLHGYAGDSTQPTETRQSEAFVRCGARGTWGEENKALLASPLDARPSATPAATLVAAPARLCAPGVSQACVGAAGCKGGQACAADGNAFGPCDCGPAPAP
ncbi:MAG TPA: hypothetical protein VH560_06045 [Polyangia bacterium]|nr:hypothetical protein [Polyangia bacterium]